MDLASNQPSGDRDGNWFEAKQARIDRGKHVPAPAVDRAGTTGEPPADDPTRSTGAGVTGELDQGLEGSLDRGEAGHFDRLAPIGFQVILATKIAGQAW